MRFVIFNGEESLTALATRVFGSAARGAKTTTKHNADALLKANPRLKDLSKISPGSLILVPDDAPEVLPGEEAIAVGTMRSQVTQNIQNALDLLQKRLGEIDSSAIDEVTTTIDRIPAAELKKGLKEASRLKSAFVDPGLDPSTLAKDAQELVKNVQAAQSARKQALTQLQKSLSAFKTT
jgi:hypothetical protein